MRVVSGPRSAQAYAAAALAPLLLLTGCLEAGTPVTKDGANDATASLPQDTGSIRATIVSGEFQPIAGAQVLLTGLDKTLLTGEDGLAVFDALEPGTYTVVAAKTGHQARQPKGRLVDVLVGEVTEVRLELEPIAVASAETTYHTTFPFAGFIACTVQVYTLAAQSCNRQVVVADPNGKSTHVWQADSIHAQSVVMETAWQSNIGAFPAQLDFGAYRKISCGAGSVTCTVGDPIFRVRGASPLHDIVREDATKNLTKLLSPNHSYPRQLYADTLVYCPSPCTVALVAQQKYEAWITVFYGEQAPDGWTIRPK